MRGYLFGVTLTCLLIAGKHFLNISGFTFQANFPAPLITIGLYPGLSVIDALFTQTSFSSNFIPAKEMKSDINCYEKIAGYS